MNGQVNSRPSQGQTAGHAQQKRLRLKLRNRVSNDDVFDVDALEVDRKPTLRLRRLATPPTILSQEQRDFLARLPPKRESLQMTNEAARSIGFRGPVNSWRIVLHALAHVGTKTHATEDGLVYEDSLGEIAAAIDRSRQATGERGHYSGRGKELWQAIEELNQLVVFMLVRDQNTNRARRRRFSLWDGDDTPVLQRGDSGKHERVRIVFRRRVLDLLKLADKEYAALFLQDYNKVGSARAMTLLTQLSVRRGWMNAPSKRMRHFVLRVEELQALLDFKRHDTWDTMRERVRSTVAQVNRKTQWKLKMEPIRDGRHVVAVRFVIEQVDRKFKNPLALEQQAEMRRIASAVYHNKAAQREREEARRRELRAAWPGEYR